MVKLIGIGVVRSVAEIPADRILNLGIKMIILLSTEEDIFIFTH
jgi:hypothetical protein